MFSYQALLKPKIGAGMLQEGIRMIKEMGVWLVLPR